MVTARKQEVHQVRILQYICSSFPGGSSRAPGAEEQGLRVATACRVVRTPTRHTGLNPTRNKAIAGGARVVPLRKGSFRTGLEAHLPFFQGGYVLCKRGGHPTLSSSSLAALVALAPGPSGPC